MAQIDVLLHGVPGRSNQAYLGQASSTLIDKTTVVDVGSLARRPLLEASLDEFGVDPANIDNVLLTHIHFDHFDNIDLFENATVHVYEDELRRIQEGNYDWATPRNAASMLENLDVATFDVGEKVVGLEVIPTPGHTEHHVGFLLDDELTYGFTGDAVKNTREAQTENPMVLYDKDAAIDTIRRIKERVDVIIPGHDTPFYVVDGAVIPAADIDFSVNLQTSSDAAVTINLSSERSTVRELPENVTLSQSRQVFH